MDYGECANLNRSININTAVHQNGPSCWRHETFRILNHLIHIIRCRMPVDCLTIWYLIEKPQEIPLLSSMEEKKKYARILHLHPNLR